MIKKIFILFLILSALLILSVFFFVNQFEPVSKDVSEKFFLVTKGSSASQIGNNLKASGLIKSSLVFKIYVQFTGKQQKIQAGEFKLSPSFNLFKVVETLQKGPYEIWVTIPEGLRREEIAEKFKNALSKDDSFINSFIKLTEDKEGYLFPDTYLFPKDVSSQNIIDKMTSTFNKKVGNDVTYDELIMASIIERETKGNVEKPIVAGILYKRINNNWPLQVDATIQYAKGSWEPILVGDKEMKSSYNTYINLGLPPAPISNPGIFSIQAAMNPEVSDFWYYLHDSEGVIHYAETLEEHNENIRKYLY